MFWLRIITLLGILAVLVAQAVKPSFGQTGIPNEGVPIKGQWQTP